MDRHNQQFDDYAKRIFGPSATISGSIGTRQGPGVLEIRVDGRTIGTGGSFQDALNASAAVTASHRATARSPRIVPSC